MIAPKNESVKVGLRVRPLNKRELQLGSPLCVETKDNVLSIKKQKDAKDFIFDYVFGIDTRQHQVYETCGYSIVENALEGFNGTIFAYGQTGAGKTFTMVGDYKDPDWKGIIPRAFEHVITAIQTSESKRYIVQSSFIEIYNEDVFDLLDGKGEQKKDVKEHPQKGVFIKDLKQVPVKSAEELFRLLDYGNRNRSVAETKMNSTSSRSHALFTVHIESLEGADKVRKSKLNFVDLAGSERQGKTGASGDTLKQGAKINLSLTALGNVINALVDGKKGGHIPYRDSKLTRLLQDSLGGNTKTLMIASVSPAADNHDETMSTLRYAARARNIKNTPKVNEDPKDALIREYMAEIQLLKKQIGTSGSNQSSEQLYRALQKAQQQKNREVSEKEAELLAMKAKMREMEELILVKQEGAETTEKTKKRRLEKKKILKNQEINENRVHQIEEEQQRDLKENQADDNKDISYWKTLAKRLKHKLNGQIQDRKNQNAEFQDERERLNQCIRNLEGNLSFYQQIAEKFLSDSDLAALKDASTFDYETRTFQIPPFLLHDERLTLPKTLKRHEVEDLWMERRKGYKLKFLTSQEPDSSPKNPKSPQTVQTLQIPQPIQPVRSFQTPKIGRKTSSSGLFKNSLLQNRRVLWQINYSDPRYQQKEYSAQNSRQTFFRRTNFQMRETSNSQNKRPTSGSFRVTSRASSFYYKQNSTQSKLRFQKRRRNERRLEGDNGCSPYLDHDVIRLLNGLLYKKNK